MSTAATPPARGAAFLARRRRNYFLFIAPALLVVGAVIIFPWLYTIWMSAFDWTIGSTAHYVGLGNYEKIFTSRRFGEWPEGQTGREQYAGGGAGPSHVAMLTQRPLRGTGTLLVLARGGAQRSQPIARGGRLAGALFSGRQIPVD